jgi:hypothetical protein
MKHPKIKKDETFEAPVARGAHGKLKVLGIVAGEDHDNALRIVKVQDLTFHRGVGKTVRFPGWLSIPEHAKPAVADFVMSFHEDTGKLPPWGALREMIRTAIANTPVPAAR